MPASRIELEARNGLRNLFCLACGAPVYTEADGAAEHTCDHVRFFIDPSGELSLADPESSTGEDQTRQQAIVDLVEATESWDDFLTRVVELLPASALVLEITAPAGSDGDAAHAVVAFDLGQTEHE
jgi:hypothetical protein